MSGAGPASPSRSSAAPLAGDRKREVLAAGSPIQPIIKDVGEIYSRLLDHRPVVQGELRYFVKEFEEKRGLRELRVLENLKNTVFETNEHILPKCEQAMHENLNEALKRLQAANGMIHKLQEREHEERKLQVDKLMAREEKHIAHWEEFMKEQQNKRAEVDEEHSKAMERLKEQYSEMEKELAKYVSF
ncbi:Biogenesis of lysosome-related organelles complex 1 subunit 5 [Mesitornis unicolor]|uniref:Biogenesis of lysosome-related organelles complex 1 subunit 5 n=1 Tax=Mesitornis unicolor TaxID=54374 RepID=A0A091RU56_9AVES|nr:PREDICTED: biogenesis of lysosome-related organelles complex 1 subunit 5 [Mesitornis unicolor]KFQ31972.1 Biogenesis of lysosome-related organelles complex 1 subunit 5 [Mesitornis unicolor]